MHDVEGSAAAWLVAEVTRLTTPWHPNAATVTRALAASAPCCGVASTVLAGLGSGSSTAILSRYNRAGLPTPKVQLQLFRLALAVSLRSRGIVCSAHIALALDHSSSASFCRHIREQTGQTAAAFLGRWEIGPFWAESVAPVMRWADDAWVTLDALEGSGKVGGRRRSLLALYGQRARAAV